MITECPVCGSHDLDHDRVTCRNCGHVFEPESAGPVILLPALTEAPAPAPAAPKPVPEQHETARGLPEAERAGDWEKWEREVVKAWEEGFRIVTLIGFSRAGKSFFANRLRRELRLHPDWTASPSEKTHIPKSEMAIDWTEIVHHANGRQRYLLADVDGEAYRSSVVRLLGESGSVQRRYLLLTALASAFLLMIPARKDPYEMDDVQTNRLVDHFDVIVGVILALQKRIRESGTHNVHENVMKEVTEEDSRRALRESIRCPQPVQVLFAQADAFPEVTTHDGDPYLFAARSAPSLFSTVDKHFPSHRFDFVSAFAGYKPNNSFAVDYRHPSYGTMAAWQWIERMTSPPRPLGPWGRRWSTTAAKWTRSVLDGEYRRSVARAAR